jgi:Acyl-ACP thioesterase
MNNSIEKPIELYEWKTKVRTFDADMQKNITLSAILRFQQEIGELQLAKVGATYESLVKNGIIFLLSTADVKILKYPKLNEEIIIKTWHQGNKGVKFIRCYQIYSLTGELLTEGKSVFVMINPKTRKIQRPEIFIDNYKCIGNNKDVNIVEDKLKKQEDMEKTGIKKLYYSDIDYNGHLNNTKYADILYDYIPEEYKKNLPLIKEFHIKFCSEGVLNKDIDIYTKSDNNTIYYRGETDKTCFLAAAYI